MKRRAVHLLVLLLLGAIVNVAVAWGCAQNNVHTGEWTYAFENKPDERQFWDTFSQSCTAPIEIASVVIERNFGHAITTAKARLPSVFVPAPDLTKPGTVYSGPPIPQGATSMKVKQEAWLVVREAGWPIRSLRQTQISAPGISQSRGSWQWSSRAPPLPIAPIWPGFAINTVFYAVVLWLLFAAPFVLRRRRRIRRGLCPKCAYDLRGTESKTCPECGMVVVLRPARGDGM